MPIAHARLDELVYYRWTFARWTLARDVRSLLFLLSKMAFISWFGQNAK